MDRLSVYDVRKKLLAEGIMPRKAKRDVWSRGPVIRMLRNESYLTGVIYYNKSEAVVARNPQKNEKYRKVKKASRRVRDKVEWIPHQAEPILVDNGLFEKVQAVLDYYKKYQKKNKKYDYLLSGLVWCQCGQRRVGDGYSAGGHHYYRCIDRIKKYPYPTTCRAQGVNAVLADGFLWKNLQNFLGDREVMREQAKKWLIAEKLRGGIDKSEVEKLDTQIASLDSEKLRYTKAYGSGTIEESQLKVLLDELDKKSGVVEKRKSELESPIMEMELDDTLIDRLCDEVEIVLANQNQGEKKKLVQDIIDKVTFYDKGVVQVAGHIPQFAHKMGHEFIGRNCWITKCWKEHAI